MVQLLSVVENSVEHLYYTQISKLSENEYNAIYRVHRIEFRLNRCSLFTND